VPMIDRDLPCMQNAAGPGYTINCSARRRLCMGERIREPGIATPNPAEHVDFLGIGQAWVMELGITSSRVSALRS